MAVGPASVRPRESILWRNDHQALFHGILQHLGLRSGSQSFSDILSVFFDRAWLHLHGLGGFDSGVAKRPVDRGFSLAGR